ncbi:MAG: SPFH domain-containing protein [Leptolyngbya sp.]|nr:SPFH domain-containing protein [Candidatus Melainabacteria bacterium]
MEIGTIVTIALLVLAGLFLAAAVFSSVYSVQNRTVKIIERFGKYNRTAQAGLNFKIPFVDTVRKVLSLQVEQHIIAIDTITKDKVSVRVACAVNYNVLEGREADSYYKLATPKTQIETFVFDVVRSQVPKLTLDEVFDSKDHIAMAVRQELATDMVGFGYEIGKVLVTEIDPDAKVKAAMNDINAAQREREAANARGEAEKTLRVKAAEAQSEADRLKGEGIAKQRLAIITGAKQSVEELKSAYPGVSEETLINMLMMTQYFETLSQLGGKPGDKVIFVPGTPDGVASFRQQIMEGLNASGGTKAADHK